MKLNSCNFSVQVFAFQYSSRVTPLWYLSRSVSQSFVIEELEQMDFSSLSGTFTGWALNYADKVYFHKHRGDRENIPNVVILFTDGKSQDDAVAKAEVRK